MRIKELREEKGLNQKDFAAEIGVAQNTLSQYETGKREPDKALLLKIAKYFDVSVDYLLGKTAFRNAQALYEFWGNNSDPFFESAFDFGKFIKEEREEQGISLKEMSTALGITEQELGECEEGILPLNLDWAEKMANFLGTNVSQILFDHDRYDGEVPEEYHSDVRKWENLTAAAEEEARREAARPIKEKGPDKKPELVIPDFIKDIAFAFHKGGIESLTQDEVDQLAQIAIILKEKKKEKDNEG